MGTSTAAAKAGGGGTVTYAEQPNAAPTYILPMSSSDYYVYQNIFQFSNLFFLPLYKFGDGLDPVLNKSLSVAYPPVFSANDTVVSVTMKHWVWSNGTPVDARDVIFWMNLLSAVTDPNVPTIGSSSAPGPGYGGSVPGGFPQNVVSYSATGTYTVTFHLNSAYNPTWFLFNELSQIYTMPQTSWDKLSSSGPVGDYDTLADTRSALPNTSPPAYVPASPGTATSGALGVAQFLNSQSQDLSTYATNPLWQVVDGPFRLTQFTVDGFVKMVPNKDYSGSPRPSFAAFEELPFTSNAAEVEALRSGNLTIGYLPAEDLSLKGSLEKNQHYSYNPWNVSGINYIAYNFTQPTDGPIFTQLYFRQAFQYLINQPEYIKRFLGGIGNIDNGPASSFPASSPYLSRALSHGEVYPYDPSKAVALLKAHGWKVNPGGVSVCTQRGSGQTDCGAGILKGQPLTFPLIYASGSAALDGIVQALESTAKREAGITLELRETSLAQVTGDSYAGCTPTSPCSNWALSFASITASWFFGPDYLPTGEEDFFTGSASNIADYTNATNNRYITATTTAATTTAEIHALSTWEIYLAKQLPRAWMPMGPFQLTMYKSGLKGLVPQDLFDSLVPQYYSLKD